MCILFLIDLCRGIFSWNSLGISWPISATAKLTFPRQNLLFHKTYFSTAKLTFPRQNNKTKQVVELLLRELDPDGCQLRKRHKWKRRQYYNPGPNAVWHADGYDKLKPYSFPVHGCIDGWSRKLLWLVVTRSNNSPDNIGSYFLDAVKTCGGVSMWTSHWFGYGEQDHGFHASLSSWRWKCP